MGKRSCKGDIVTTKKKRKKTKNLYLSNSSLELIIQTVECNSKQLHVFLNYYFMAKIRFSVQI